MATQRSKGKVKNKKGLDQIKTQMIRGKEKIQINYKLLYYGLPLSIPKRKMSI
jgi:hypothetical protein